MRSSLHTRVGRRVTTERGKVFRLEVGGGWRGRGSRVVTTAALIAVLVKHRDAIFD